MRRIILTILLLCFRRPLAVSGANYFDAIEIHIKREENKKEPLIAAYLDAELANESHEILSYPYDSDNNALCLFLGNNILSRMS